MQNLDFLICPVLYLASACFLASEALPRCLAESSPRPGQVSHLTPKAPLTVSWALQAPRGIYFSWVYSQFPYQSPNPVEQGRGSAVHKQYGAGLCFPTLCVGGGCRAPLQGRWQLALPVVSRLGASGAGLCLGRAGDPTAAYMGRGSSASLCSSTTVSPLL